MDHILVIGRNFEVEGWTSGARSTGAEVGVIEGVGMGSADEDEDERVTGLSHTRVGGEAREVREVREAREAREAREVREVRGDERR
jgi:hypothetical protein